MANIVVAVLLCFLLLMNTAIAVPWKDTDTWYININMHKLYTLVEDGEHEFHDIEGSQIVLEKLLASASVNIEFIDKENALGRLHSKIKHLFSNLKSKVKKGGKSKFLLLEKWQKEDYKLNVGCMKRKLEFEVEEQRKLRKIAEKTKSHKEQEIISLKRKQQSLKNFISRVIKRKYMYYKTKKKTYSRAWIRQMKLRLAESINDAASYMNQIGLKPVLVVAKDEYGNEIKMEWTVPRNPCESKRINLDEVIYRKDRHLISDFAYKELSLLSADLPSLKVVKKRSAMLNSLFNIKHLPNDKGVCEPLESKLNWLISQLIVKESVTKKRFCQVILR